MESKRDEEGFEGSWEEIKEIGTNKIKCGGVFDYIKMTICIIKYLQSFEDLMEDKNEHF